MTGYPLEISTERLLLRQWRDDDIEPLAAIYADPEVERQLVPTSLEQTAAQIERFRSVWAAGELSWHAVEERATGRLVGRAGLLRSVAWHLEASPVEVGWTFDRSTWGRGYATEAGGAAIRAGFTLADITRVITFTRPTNLASRRVMDKLGFTYRGATVYKDIDHVWYDVTREEWSAASADR